MADDAAAAHRKAVADLIADLVRAHERYPDTFATTARESVLEAYLRGLRARHPWQDERHTPVVQVDETRPGNRFKRRR